MTLTFNPIPTEVKVNLNAKSQGRRSSGLVMRAPTNRQTDTHTGPMILPLPLTRDVLNGLLSIVVYSRHTYGTTLAVSLGCVCWRPLRLAHDNILQFAVNTLKYFLHYMLHNTLYRMLVTYKA